MNVGKFIITGIIGFVGIGFKEKVISFCQRKANKAQIPINKCESLDFVEATHRHKVYPLMYCYMELDRNLDIDQLQIAVIRSCQYVPEILQAYDFARGRFIDKGFTVGDIISHASDLPQWKLDKRPQLQIVINDEKKKMIIGMSHILTDGVDFLQYLYLLSFLYNGHTPAFPLENCRDIAPVLKNVHIGRATEQTRQHKHITVPPLRKSSNGKKQFCLCSHIYPEDFSTLYCKSRKQNVTLNDVFITAYARVISRLHEIQTVVIPCPADLRKFSSMQGKFTVANMTGIYRKIVVEIKPQHSFSQTLSQVHIEMELQKSRFRCLVGIRPLDYTFHKIPRFILALGIKWFYHLLPVSYTNFGKIDHTKLFFNNCKITSCYTTGTYRFPPDFQISISTFQNVCTLNCTLTGQDTDKMTGQHILDEVKNEIIDWGNT